MHVDGDAFFASCEQALHPHYRNKPLITGAERGIAASMSYQAKRAGVTRGMRVGDVKRICPDCIIVPSDYEAYSLFSKRMFDIIAEVTPAVEEYSIDEAFADLSGLRRPLHGSYSHIARGVKNKIESELGISVSVGVSLSKTLAKVASEYRKPGGLTVISGGEVAYYLKRCKISDVWGIGPNTAALLQKYNINNALDFAGKDEVWIKKMLTKPGVETWRELRGESIYPVSSDQKREYKSISKFKTFTPPTCDKKTVFAQLLRNTEKACIKTRRYNLCSDTIVIFLRRFDFSHTGCEIHLNRATAYPVEMAPVVREVFDRIFESGVKYRQTGVVLQKLQSNTQNQYSLFESQLRVEKIRKVFAAIDKMAQKYGKHTLHIASSLPVDSNPQHQGSRSVKPQRRSIRLLGERGRQRLGLPYFFAEV